MLLTITVVVTELDPETVDVELLLCCVELDDVDREIVLVAVVPLPVAVELVTALVVEDASAVAVGATKSLFTARVDWTLLMQA